MPTPSYFAIPTLVGADEIATSIAGGDPVNATTMVVGDGGGAPMTPVDTMTGLIRQVWTGALTSVFRDGTNANWVHFQATVPAGDGPFVIREIGILDSDNRLIAIGNYPDTYKPVPSDGASTDVLIDFILIVSDTATVNLTVEASTYLTISGLLRAPFIAVNSQTISAPPGSPGLGDTYVVAPTGTGMWTGQDNNFAQWNGQAWVFAVAKKTTIIGCMDTGFYMARTATGWVRVMLPTRGQLMYFGQTRGHYGSGEN